MTGEDPIVFDGGAHVGDYVQGVLDAPPQATIHAFEPAADSFAALARRPYGVHLFDLLGRLGDPPHRQGRRLAHQPVPRAMGRDSMDRQTHRVFFFALGPTRMRRRSLRTRTDWPAGGAPFNVAISSPRCPASTDRPVDALVGAHRIDGPELHAAERAAPVGQTWPRESRLH